MSLQEQASKDDAAAFEAAEKSLIQRVRKSAELLVKSLLFSEEATLTAPIAGTSEFTREFAARGIKDSKGRSLRDFDLQTRMFRYPCSYLIETSAFDSLPVALKLAVADRMKEILTASTPVKGFEHLSDEDRAAVLSILMEIKPGLMN